MVFQINGVPLRKHIVESLVPLAQGDRSLTVKEVAQIEGVSPGAISARRRRLERKLKVTMPRNETRGRKPKPVAVAA